MAILVELSTIVRASSFFELFALVYFRFTISASQKEHSALVSLNLQVLESPTLPPITLVSLDSGDGYFLVICSKLFWEQQVRLENSEHKE